MYLKKINLIIVNICMTQMYLFHVINIGKDARNSKERCIFDGKETGASFIALKRLDSHDGYVLHCRLEIEKLR